MIDLRSAKNLKISKNAISPLLSSDGPFDIASWSDTIVGSETKGVVDGTESHV